MIVRYDFQIDVENQHRAQEVMQVVGEALHARYPGFCAVANKNHTQLDGSYFRLRFDGPSDPNNASGTTKPTLAERLASVPVAGVH